MRDDKIPLASIGPILYPANIEPVTHMVALRSYNIHMIVYRIFVQVQPAIVLRTNESVFVLALLEVDTKELVSLSLEF